VDGQTVIYSGTRRGTKAVKVEKQGDKFVAKELWSNPQTWVQFNTPVLKDGLVYGLTLSNEFFCIKEDNGQTAWSAPARQPSGGTPPTPAGQGGRGRGRGGMGGGGYGSIVDVGSVLLALTPSQELLVLQPSDKQYTVLARYKVASTPTHAYPVVSGNRLFIKDQDSVALWTID
jgi:hypothetical protein